jgi:hypothetical protein
MSSRKTLDRFEIFLHAWAKLRPGKTFGGLALEQATALIQPCRDVRAEIAEAELRQQSANARRATVDADFEKALQRVINAVKADPEEGDDGELYEAMGFVRRSVRSTGLTWRRKEQKLPGADAAPKAVPA